MTKKMNTLATICSNSTSAADNNQKTINVVIATLLDNPESRSADSEPFCALLEWGPEYADLYRHLLAKAYNGVLDPSMQQHLWSVKDEIVGHEEEILEWLEGRREFFEIGNIRFSRLECLFIAGDDDATPTSDTFVFLRYAEEERTPTGPVYRHLDENIATLCGRIKFITPASAQSAYLHASPIQEVDGKLLVVSADDDSELMEIAQAKDYGSIYAVSDGKKWGLVDQLGRWLLHLKFDSIEAPNCGYWILESKGKYGLLVDATGDLVPMVYDEIDPIESGMPVLVRKDGVLGYINAEDCKFYRADDEENWPEDVYFFYGL